MALTWTSVGAAAFFVAGLVVSEVVRFARDSALESKRAARAIEAEERRWTREDEIRLETAQANLDAERRRIEREDALWNREVQGARRVVADELDTLYNHLGMMLRKNQWPDEAMVGRGNFLSLRRWHEHMGTLASAFDDQQQFMNLAGFIYSVEQLRARVGTQHAGTPIATEERTSLARMQNDAHALYWVVLGGYRLEVDDNGKRALVPVEGAPPTPPLRPFGPARPDGSILSKLPERTT